MSESYKEKLVLSQGQQLDWDWSEAQYGDPIYSHAARLRIIPKRLATSDEIRRVISLRNLESLDSQQAALAIEHFNVDAAFIESNSLQAINSMLSSLIIGSEDNSKIKHFLGACLSASRCVTLDWAHLIGLLYVHQADRLEVLEFLAEKIASEQDSLAFLPRIKKVLETQAYIYKHGIKGEPGQPDDNASIPEIQTFLDSGISNLDKQTIARADSTESLALLNKIRSFFGTLSTGKSINTQTYIIQTFDSWSRLQEIENGTLDESVVAFAGILTNFRAALEAMLDEVVVAPFKNACTISRSELEPRYALSKSIMFGNSIGIGSLYSIIYGDPRSRVDDLFQDHIKKNRKHLASILHSNKFKESFNSLRSIGLGGVAHNEEQIREKWAPMFETIRKEMYGDLEADNFSIVGALIGCPD